LPFEAQLLATRLAYLAAVYFDFSAFVGSEVQTGHLSPVGKMAALAEERTVALVKLNFRSET
jgi:hypothetical protein